MKIRDEKRAMGRKRNQNGDCLLCQGAGKYFCELAWAYYVE